jgi:hypothetical protein
MIPDDPTGGRGCGYFLDADSSHLGDEREQHGSNGVEDI